MLYQGLTGESSPPEITIETETIVPGEGGYLVRIRVANRGGSVAAQLTVEGALREGPATVEQSAITMDYLPAGSERRGGLFFSRDPRKYDLQIRAKGYRDP